MNKYRIGTDVPFQLSVADGVEYLDLSNCTILNVAMYCDAQEAFAGSCTWELNAEDHTRIDCVYPGNRQAYTGIMRAVVVMEDADGEKKAYDLADIFEIVATTEEANATEDTVTSATLSAWQLPMSTLSTIVEAAINATEGATNSTISEISYTASTEDDGYNVLHIEQEDGTEYDFNIKNGSRGKSAYQVAVDNGYEGTEEEFASILEQTADEEDITINASNRYQLKDRIYNAQQPNGMGYKILRKDATLASQVTDTNTIYEIRYDFDLNNTSVTIPAGCVLKFNGGKIANGSIAFNGCSLEKDDAANIFENITAFSGNITGYFTPENVSYGLAGDCFAALLSLLKSSQTLLLKVNTMSLTGDTDLQGVWLDATKIVLNGYTLRIGGGSNRITDVPGAYGKGENQNILSINTNGNRSGRVIVGRCAGYDLHIGHYSGKLEFVVDANNGGIAYSSFYLDSISSIELSAASGITGAWINTNRFVLNRCVSFVVKSSLAYFNNNSINMGCFEGAFKIRLERGNNNVFTDIRGEATSAARGELYFADTTFSNRVEIMFYPTAKIFDYGRGNIVRNNVLYDSRLIDKANISLQDLKKNLPSRIMGMTLSQDGTYMVPSSTYDVIGNFEKYFARYYQSGFIPYRRGMTIFALLEVISKNESGLGFTYELYDAEYNPLYVTKAGGTGVPLAMIRTSDSAYKDLTSGTFFNAFNMQANYRPGSEHVVDNSYILFQFNEESALNLINSGDEEVAATLGRVKYITISVVGNTYFYSFNSQLLSVGVSLYESGYKVRLFNSDVGETPSE